MADSEMVKGYPTESDIEDILADLGLEIPTLSNSNYYAEFKQFVWGLVNAANWAMALGVYCPSPATFNVRGGKYLFKDAILTYTPGTAVDPTNNDTTYIWMDDANAIGHAVDGTGWPTTEHIKLAEIDVDADGVITAIRDLRGETFLQKIGNLTGNHAANIGINGGVPFILTATLVAGNTVVIHNANAPFKYRIINAWGFQTSADGGTVTIKNGTNTVINFQALSAADKEFVYINDLNDAYQDVAVNGSLSVVGAAGADCIVYIECVRVA